MKNKKDIYGRKTYPNNPCPQCGGIEYPHEHSIPSVESVKQNNSCVFLKGSELCITHNINHRSGDEFTPPEEITKNNWEEKYPIPEKEEWEESLKKEFMEFYLKNKLKPSENYTDYSLLVDFWLSQIKQAEERHNQDCTREEWARESERQRIVKEAEKLKKKELFIGETQYRFEKGNVAWVRNQGIGELINIITNQ